MIDIALLDPKTSRLPKSQLTLPHAAGGGVLRGQVPVCSRSGASQGSNSVITGVTTHMNRFVIPVLCKSFDWRLVYTINNQFAALANDLDIEAWLELGPTTAFAVTWTTAIDDGLVIPVSFGSELKRTVKSGARFLVSDPIGLLIDPATTPYVAVHTRVNVADTAKLIPTARQSLSAYGDALATDAAALAVTTPGTFYGAAASVAVFAPAAIIGTPTDEIPVTSISFGDSITRGDLDNQAELPYSRKGYWERALKALNIPHINASNGGKKASDFTSLASFGAASLLPLASGITHVWASMGRNDLSDLGTFAALQATEIAYWTVLGAQGGAVSAPTITPRSQSTDLFETLVNQSAHALSNDAARIPYNQWLRNGAPIIAGAAAGVGASGPTVSRCDVYNSAGVKIVARSGPPHPLKTVIDIASVVESAVDSGKWRAAKWVGTGDTHTTQTVDNLVTIGGALEQYDQIISTAGGIVTGRYALTYVPGAASLTTNVATTATQAGARIVAAFSDDGLHPQRAGHVLMAALLQSVLPSITI